ncbi:unnamed protein product [Symbiodinium sp. CCMP2456]|nr:unnamed protein product [Symbiodinium sp. CCMP2456]
MRDPTFTGDELQPMAFLWKFCLSFCGYLDAYQDSISIAIALSCSNPLAQTLGWCMLVSFAVGVVGLQWGVMGFICFQDPTKACFLKLIHLDTLAARLTLPEDFKSVWHRLHLVRTLCEDIPQAILQTIYILKISRNFFMILSVCTAVGGSLMALVDAVNRRLIATGFRKETIMKVKSLHVAMGWAIHGVAFVMHDEKVTGVLVANR